MGDMVKEKGIFPQRTVYKTLRRSKTGLNVVLRRAVESTGMVVSKAAKVTDELTNRTMESSGDMAFKTIQTSQKLAQNTMVVSHKAAKKTVRITGKAVDKTAEKVDKKINRGRAKSRSHYLLLLLHFFGPILSFFIFFVILFLILPGDIASRYLFSGSIYLVPSPFGDKTILITTAPSALRYGRYLMAIELCLMDTLLAWFLSYNLEWARDWKKGDKMFRYIEKKTGFLFQKRPWIRKVATIFLALFVMFPLQGSGGLVASLVGKFMGLKPWKVIISISIGSLIGCIAIAYMADTIAKVFSTPVKVTLFGILVLLIGSFFVYSHRKEKRFLAKNP